MRRSTFLAAAAIALGLTAPSAFGQAAATSSGQAYPNKPIRMVVPFPTGAATDMAARVIGQQVSTILRQPVVIDNKPGAGGSIAAMEVVRAAPDGYTLMFASNSAISSNVALLKKIPYDPNKDFSPIAGTGETALVLLVKSGFPVKDLKELIAYIKSHKGKVNAGYGSSSSQISIATFDKLAGVETLQVPYKGIPLAVNDVLGGTLDYTFADIGNAMAQVKGGNMRALGVTAAKRSPLMADVPSISEVLPGFDITAWFGIVGPAGMPKDVVDKLNAVTTHVLRTPEMKERLATIGLTPMPMAPEPFKGFIAKEIVKWTRLAREANIQPE